MMRHCRLQVKEVLIIIGSSGRGGKGHIFDSTARPVQHDNAVVWRATESGAEAFEVYH